RRGSRRGITGVHGLQCRCSATIIGGTSEPRREEGSAPVRSAEDDEAGDGERAAMSTDSNAPRPALRTFATRRRASMLVKIVSPLIVALIVGSVVTALYAGRLSGGPSRRPISATDLLVLGLLLVGAAVALSWLTVRTVTRPLRVRAA